ncbi:MAG: hypothetical protein K6B38_08940 [Ruminococcus sp.]|nr:hypothetical protein [Ruminococcus sp.]
MEKHYRKLNRLKNYDYSSNGLYFVTFCTKNRVHYLSEIIYDDPFDEFSHEYNVVKFTENQIVGDGVLDVPHVKHTDFGKIVNDQINEINKTYNDINIMKYVIMPDHVHMIIYLFDDKNVLGGTSRTPSPTNARIPALISTLKRFVNKKIGYNIWQRSFHDHIIRSEREFLEICGYIDNNPINWVNHIYNQNFWR